MGLQTLYAHPSSMDVEEADAPPCPTFNRTTPHAFSCFVVKLNSGVPSGAMDTFTDSVAMIDLRDMFGPDA
jgi:hypothetical protein